MKYKKMQNHSVIIFQILKLFNMMFFSNHFKKALLLFWLQYINVVKAERRESEKSLSDHFLHQCNKQPIYRSEELFSFRTFNSIKQFTITAFLLQTFHFFPVWKHFEKSLGSYQKHNVRLPLSSLSTNLFVGEYWSYAWRFNLALLWLWQPPSALRFRRRNGRAGPAREDLLRNYWDPQFLTKMEDVFNMTWLPVIY